VPPRRWLVHEEPSADAIHGERDRRKVDDDFIGEAAHIDAAIVGRYQRYRFAAERSEGISTHRSAGTIGIGSGEVNGRRQRVPDVR
jgi:hypothetical protein